jgi:aconitase A
MAATDKEPDLTQEEVEKMLEDDDDNTLSQQNKRKQTVSSGTNTGTPSMVNAGTTMDDKIGSRRRSTVSTSSAGGSGMGKLPRAYYRAASAEAHTVRPHMGSEVLIKNDLVLDTR